MTETSSDGKRQMTEEIQADFQMLARWLQGMSDRAGKGTAERVDGRSLGRCASAINSLTNALADREARLKDFDWHPIETAAKYDPPVELYDPTLIDPDFRPDGIVCGHWQDDEGWVGGVWCIAHEQFESRVIHPTHWRLKRPPT